VSGERRFSPLTEVVPYSTIQADVVRTLRDMAAALETMDTKKFIDEMNKTRLDDRRKKGVKMSRLTMTEPNHPDNVAVSVELWWMNQPREANGR
jgi:hypothetical protein